MSEATITRFIGVQICNVPIVKKVTSAVDLIKKCIFLFKSSTELTLIVRSGKGKNSGYPKW